MSTKNGLLDITKLTNEERDKLILNMALAIVDLTGAIRDLITGVDLLLKIVVSPSNPDANA